MNTYDESIKGLLSDKQATDYLGLAAGTLSVWRSTGRYQIPFIKIGANVRYRQAALDAWLEFSYPAQYYIGVFMGRITPSPKDPKGSHIRLYATIHTSFAWSVLSPSAKALWVDLRTQIGSTRNGTVTTALEILKHKNWSSRHTVARARSELLALGFIVLTRQGEIFRGSKSCNLYRFTDEPVYEQPKVGLNAMKADNLFLKFSTKKEAIEIIKGLKLVRDDKKKRALEKKRKGSNLHVISEDSALIPQKISANCVHKASQLG